MVSVSKSELVLPGTRLLLVSFCHPVLDSTCPLPVMLRFHDITSLPRNNHDQVLKELKQNGISTPQEQKCRARVACLTSLRGRLHQTQSLWSCQARLANLNHFQESSESKGFDQTTEQNPPNTFQIFTWSLTFGKWSR